MSEEMTKEQYLQQLEIELHKIKLEKEEKKKQKNQILLKQITIIGTLFVSV